MRASVRLGVVGMAVFALNACSSSGSNNGFEDAGNGPSSNDSGDTPKTDAGSEPAGDSGSFGGGGAHPDAGSGTPVIYAHTDTELYAMDPLTHAVTDIGPFEGVAPCGTSTAVTDLAINGNDEIWVNTECALYQAKLPASGKGSVAVTLKTKISGGSSQKFYALAFAPAGVLGADEGLVAGDNLGELYAIDTSTGATQDLGGFGSKSNGASWSLSGDLVFYTQNGAPLGLATLRTSSSSTNDSLAMIDMDALAAAYRNKTPGALLKKIYGSGTGFGKLFGVGAWGNDVYAFARVGKSADPAQLVQIDESGTGTSLQTFPSITAGWSGAGVTTKAAITIAPPK